MLKRGEVRGENRENQGREELEKGSALRQRDVSLMHPTKELRVSPDLPSISQAAEETISPNLGL